MRSPLRAILLGALLAGCAGPSSGQNAGVNCPLEPTNPACNASNLDAATSGGVSDSSGGDRSGGDGGASGGATSSSSGGQDVLAADIATDGSADTDATGSSGGGTDTTAGDGGSSGSSGGGCVKSTPPDEICDGKDNDCDGQTDNAACDDGNVCTLDHCEADKYDGKDKDSGCRYDLNNGKACETGQKCVTGAKCSLGVCGGGAQKTCDDGESCTFDDCKDTTGGCDNIYIGDGKFCNDGKACTNPDTCSKGKCSGKVVGSCDDGKDCTADDCDDTGQCSHQWQIGVPCSDQNPCTIKDVCQQLGCFGEPTTCDDGNPCTTDTCDANKGGCVVEKVAAGTLCNQDACNQQGKCNANGACTDFAITCDDKNPCTTDVCDDKAGTCVHNKLMAGSPCNDGDPCTQGEKCSAANTCEPPAGQKGCDDGNPCTDDQCNLATLKCSFHAKPAGAVCDDGDQCTIVTYCYGGTCGPGASEKVSTVAGSGAAGYTDATALSAAFNSPHGIAIAPNGDLYIGDRNNHRIRRVDMGNQVVKTFAGSGMAAYKDGPAAVAAFNHPEGLAVDAAGALYIGDRDNHRIRRLGPDGRVGTLAGSGSNSFKDGPAAQAAFSYPEGVAVDLQGAVYVADSYNQRIRKISTSGTVTTLAGSSSYGFKDGKGAEARLYRPRGVAVAPDGVVYVADTLNNRIRRITPGGTVTTLAGQAAGGWLDGMGTGAKFSSPMSVFVDVTGAIVVGDFGNNRVRRITPKGVVTTLAGNGTANYKDGNGKEAMFRQPYGVVADAGGHVYLAEQGNHRIRRIDAPFKVCHDGSPCTIDSCDKKTGLCAYQKLGVGTSCDDGSVCTAKDACDAAGKCTGFAKPCADGNACTDDGCNPLTGDCVFTPNSAKCNDDDACTRGDRCLAGTCQAGAGKISTVAGEGTAQTKDDADALKGSLNYPTAVQVDAAGKVYVAEGSGNVIRSFTVGGALSTLAGSGAPKYADGKGAAASFNAPGGIAVTGDGVVYVADTLNHRIRKIDKAANVTLVAGSGSAAFADGTGKQSSFNAPGDVALDAFGNLLVADTKNHRIRRIDPGGKVTTLAGSYASGLVDGVGGAARFHEPGGVTVDAKGDVYVADSMNHAIRRVQPDGRVTTIAGKADSGFANGKGDAARFNRPFGIAFDPSGGLIVADRLNNRVRRVTLDGVVATLAGSAVNGFIDGAPEDARFSQPIGIGLDATGRVFIADRNNSRVRMMAASRTICDDGKICTADHCDKKSGKCGYKTIGNGEQCDDGNPCTVGETCDAAGACEGLPRQCDDGNGCTKDACSPYSGGCQHQMLEGFCNDGDPCTSTDLCLGGKCSGNVFILESLAGIGAGFADGSAAQARFNNPHGLDADDKGNVYVADYYNRRIRRVEPSGKTTTWAGTGSSGFRNGPWNQAYFYYPTDVAVDGGNVYVADRNNQRIRRIDSSPTRMVSTYSGAGAPGFADGPPTTARFNYPYGLASDRKGTLYVADTNNQRIRRVAPGGAVTTLAGTGASSFADGPGNKAMFRSPMSVAVAPDGYVWVGDSSNYRVRRIAPDGTTTTVAGNGVSGTGGYKDGKGIGVTFDYLYGIAVLPDGDALVTQYNRHTLRLVKKDGTVTTFMGKQGDGGTKDGIGDQIRFSRPWGVAVGTDGNIHVSSIGDHRIRRVTNPVKHCNDGNECTTEKCDPKTGECAATKVPDGTACIDGQLCLMGRVCNVGKCVGGVPKNCNDKNTCTLDSCDGATGQCVHKPGPGCVRYRKVFVTSQQFRGNVGVYVEGVDGRCQSLAMQAGLKGTWRAWIGARSKSGTYGGPAQRFNRLTAGSYRRLDGKIIAKGWSDLVDGSIATPINLSETGGTVSKGSVYSGCTNSLSGAKIWTNVRTSGSMYSSSSRSKCSSWSTSSSNSYYRVPIGDANATNAKWTQACNYGRCNYYGRLYCFAQTDSYAKK